VGEKPDDTRRLLDRFLDRLDLQAIRYQGAQVAMHHPSLRPWSKAGSTSVYLVGDAAGQVKVTSVGGTVTGLWGACAAVNAITKGTSYTRELRSLKRELDVHWIIRWLLERLDNAGYDRLIECVTPSVRNFLSHRNRDQMMGGFWRLPFREPKLALLGMKLFFKRSTQDTYQTTTLN
jgi:flavin-dependent dehydrogenase